MNKQYVISYIFLLVCRVCTFLSYQEQYTSIYNSAGKYGKKYLIIIYVYKCWTCVCLSNTCVFVYLCQYVHTYDIDLHAHEDDKYK